MTERDRERKEIQKAKAEAKESGSNQATCDSLSKMVLLLTLLLPSFCGGSPPGTI
jgi:hypothetical protein